MPRLRPCPFDAKGHVPWWGENDPVTLHWILVPMIAETHRHAVHADILCESIDGAIGHRLGVENLPDVDRDWWPGYVVRVEAEARRSAAMQD